MLLIGLAGSAGSGKDTVADYLVEQYGFVKFSFSDELYREVSEAFGVPIEELRDRDNKEKPHPQLTARQCSDENFAHHMMDSAGDSTYAVGDSHQRVRAAFSPRWVLQHWGTEYRRAQNPDYWIERAALWVKAFLDVTAEDTARPTGLVNTSVRFPNEQALIHALGGTVWHLRRFGTRLDAALSGVASGLDHVAEQGLPLIGCDRELFNSGTVEQLGTAVSLLLQAPLEENHEAAIDPDADIPDEAYDYPGSVLVACDKCGKPHVGISRARAEHEVTAFNEWFDQQPEKTQELFGGEHVAIEHYEGCSCCGHSGFTEFEPWISDAGDAAAQKAEVLATASAFPVIYEGAK